MQPVVKYTYASRKATQANLPPPRTNKDKQKPFYSEVLYTSNTGPVTLAPHASRYSETRHLEQITLSHCDANPRLTDEELHNSRALTQFDWA